MKILNSLVFSALLLAGCNKQTEAERDALDKDKPGYQVAKYFCSQCHALPFADQHPPAAWPYVVSRMEGHMSKAGKPLPSAEERESIIGFLQGKR